MVSGWHSFPFHRTAFAPDFPLFETAEERERDGDKYPCQRTMGLGRVRGKSDYLGSRE